MTVEFMKKLMEVSTEEWFRKIQDEQMTESIFDVSTPYERADVLLKKLKPFLDISDQQLYEVKQILFDAIDEAYQQGYLRRK